MTPTPPLDLAAIRAHTITATPMVNGRGGLQYHCTTCGTLTYFQPPTLPCLGSLSEALAEVERLRTLLGASQEAERSLHTRVALASEEVERLRAEAIRVSVGIELLAMGAEPDANGFRRGITSDDIRALLANGTTR